MFSVQSTFGFASGYPKPYISDEEVLFFYAQDCLDVYPNMLGSLYAPAPNSEVSPWAWQWNEGTRIQEYPFTHHLYTASVTQAQVQPTYAADQAPPAFCRAVGGPVSNKNRPEIVCPQPIYPRPKWIDMTGLEEDEDKTTPEVDEGKTELTPGPVDTDTDTDWEGEEWFDEEDYGEGFRFLPSFILSPDAEDLPAPFFHPSGNSTPLPRTLASFSPEACDLPQPRFNPGLYSPVSDVSSRSSVSGPSQPRSSRFDSFGSIVSPNPEELPPPDFEFYDRLEVGGFEFPGPLDCRQDRIGKRGTRGHTRCGLGEGLWEAVKSPGRKVSGSKHHRRRWVDWTWDS